MVVFCIFSFVPGPRLPCSLEKREGPSFAHPDFDNEDDLAARPVVETSTCSDSMHSGGEKRFRCDTGYGSCWQEVVRGMQEAGQRSHFGLSIPHPLFCSNGVGILHNGDCILSFTKVPLHRSRISSEEKMEENGLCRTSTSAGSERSGRRIGSHRKF